MRGGLTEGARQVGFDFGADALGELFGAGEVSKGLSGREGVCWDLQRERQADRLLEVE